MLRAGERVGERPAPRLLALGNIKEYSKEMVKTVKPISFYHATSRGAGWGATRSPAPALGKEETTKTHGG